MSDKFSIGAEARITRGTIDPDTYHDDTIDTYHYLREGTIVRIIDRVTYQDGMVPGCSECYVVDFVGDPREVWVGDYEDANSQYVYAEQMEHNIIVPTTLEGIEAFLNTDLPTHSGRE